MTIEVIPSKSALGAEVRGVDLRRPISAGERERIVAAWYAHLVLLIRGPVLSEPQLLAFTRNFGELDLPPSNENSAVFGGDNAQYPELAVISNIIEAGKPIGALGAGEAYWHTDTSFVERPPAGSFLHAREIPPVGGNTQFCNMYAAYETLPRDLKARIEGRKAIHNFAYTSAGHLRKGYEAVSDVTSAPGAHHPLVRTHGATGRKALFLGRRLGSYILGMPVAESEELLDALWAHATQSRFTWTQEWQVGDLIIWDNRCTMHRRDAFDPSARRLMHRAQIKGELPA